MTATDELRAELTKRGVEWEDMSARFPTGMLWCTSWTSQDGEPCTAIEGADDIPDGKLSVQALLTPEQAIEATLGRGTCHKVRVHKDIEDEEHCSECGRFLGFANDALAEPYNFCPKCGAEVVDE